MRGSPRREGGGRPRSGLKTAVQRGLGSEGKAFPSSELYITGFTEKKDEKEYDVICKRFGLVFKNII